MFSVILMAIQAALTVGGVIVALKAKHHAPSLASNADRYDTYDLKRREEDARDKARRRRILGFVSAAVSGVLLLTTLFTSVTYTLDAGEAAVIKSWTGEVEDAGVYSESGGLHFKSPLQDVTAFSVRNQQITFQPQGGEDIQITAKTRDNASVFMDVTLSYNQEPSSVVEIYKVFHTAAEMRSQLIRDARAALQMPTTQFSTMEISQKRPELEEYATRTLRQRLEEKYNITLTSVSIRNMSFTEEVQKSLNAVQSRNAEVEQARASLEQARISAETTKTNARAASDADQIIRCGATTEIGEEVINGVKTKVTRVVPVPNAQCQNRLNEQVLSAKYIDALEKMAEKGNLIVVPQGFQGMLNIPKKD